MKSKTFMTQNKGLCEEHCKSEVLQSREKQSSNYISHLYLFSANLMMMAACYLLLVWTASFFLASGFLNDDICDYSNRNLTAIPLDLPLNTTKLILSYNKIDIDPNSTEDNPWNCTCKLLSLQKRVKDTNVTLANYNKTTCESPTELKGQCILTVLINGTQCSAGSTTTKAPQFSTIQSKGSIARDSSSVTNETKTKEQDSQPIGSSWHFLLGVIVAALSTSMLIVCAVKCPTWYKIFFSYQHQQLQEEDLDTLENMGKFTDDEDGFIEDKYIDSVECNNSREN
ncbi:hypothetical protein AOXY_G2082 [Acipenser oxyrinchus oxyrinchus]|uniref:LRRCT domain-containing protein n=1 Tax=Acipenser oxyrinchus oxyrinchus TaxID=40147 RepID=A0AAD8LTX2_ACIOX|nr:hypothetical protein AOXY_G2082 [Acipenser oxyrinchus oxyrinchus]